MTECDFPPCEQRALVRLDGRPLCGECAEIWQSMTVDLDLDDAV